MSVDIARLQIEVESLKVRQAADDLDRLKRSGAGAAKEAGGLKAMFGGFGPLLATMGLGLLAKQFLSVNVEAQRLQSSLYTVEGSGKAAAVAFAALEKFAVETPFQLDEVTQAYISLKARGLDATMPAMAAYGDLAGAMGMSIRDAVDGTSQALIGNLERVRGWGFTVIQQGDKVKISLGQTTMTVKKNSADMQAAFLAISRAEFGGAAARQAKTLGGAISNLEDGWQALLRTIGNSGGGDVMAAPVLQLTEWLGKARTKMIEISQDTTFQELVVVVGDSAREVGVLTGELASLLGKTTEAGVTTGAFVRVLQGLRMVVLGIRSAYQGMGLLFLRELEAMAGGMIRLTDAALSMPKLAKLLGFDKAELAAGREFFVNVETWANESSGKLAGSFEDATERMLSDFETTSERAKQRVAEVRKALQDAQGDQSKVGARRGNNEHTLSEAEKGKIKEAQNALREFGIEAMKNLGLIDEWSAKEANLLEKIKPLGPVMKARVQTMFEELRATEELNKENELRASLEARRAAVAASVEEADRKTADGFRNMADPMREYRIQLQNINELELTGAQARLARASAAESINADALSPIAKEAIDREKLNAQLAAGAIHVSHYTTKMRELTLNSTSAAGEIARAMEAASSSMTQAFVNFVTTGKASFKDLVSSILADLARMYAQKVMTQFLGMAIDWIGGGGGGASASSASSFSSMQSGYGGWGAAIAGARASGGPVAGGAPYLVGERGPEVFVPGSAGSIAPNGALGSSSVQISMTNNFYSDGSRDSQVTGDQRDGKKAADSLYALMDSWAIRNMRPNGLLNPGSA